MDRRSYLSQFHKFQINRERHFAPKLYSALKSQYESFITNKKRGMSDSDALLHISSHGIYTILKSIYADSVHYGSLVYSQLPKAPKRTKRRAPIGFNEEISQLINAYFEGDILNFSEGITDTTRDLIRVVLTIAYEEGRALTWIVDRLIEDSKLSRSRSRLIARTETVTSTNQAGYFAASKTGLLMDKEWISTQDSRVRQHHQEVNGHKVDMEGYFDVGGILMSIPGARTQKDGTATPASEVCNCRCTALYLPKRDVNGRLIEMQYHSRIELAGSQ